MQLSSKDGMQTLNQALADLVIQRIVTIEEAMIKSSNPERMKKLVQSVGGASRLQSAS